MKDVLIGAAVIAVIAGSAFAYRALVELPQQMYVAPTVATSTECTQEAKLCPDGSAVGRTAANCAFATCPLPNVSLTVGSTTLAFVLPSGYHEAINSNTGSAIAMYQQSGTTTSAASLVNVYAYAIPQGQTAGQVMLSKTVFDPSGMQASSTSAFKNVTEGSNLFSEVQIGDFEGQVETAYYLTTIGKVFRFDVTERNVQNWNDPNLNADTLPQHRALLQTLATLQVSSS